MARPLEGLRVIDVGTRIGAPFCAGLLGEWGAEVVKVEQPRAGDFMRTIGPFVDGYSLFWAVEGRGRKSVTCDLRTPEGQDLFRRLAATADVVCENFRPGTMEDWGLGPDALDPRLVFVRISAFGQDGPYAERPGLDRLGVAYGGLLHLTGEPDRPPVRPGVTVADYLTGVFAAEAALAALYRRDAAAAARGRPTGRGAVIDASLYGSVLRILEWTIPAYDRLGTVRSPRREPAVELGPARQLPDGRRELRVRGGRRRRQLRPPVPGHGSPRPPRGPPLRHPGRPGPQRRHHQRAGGAVDLEPDARPRSRGVCIAHDVPVATAYSARDIALDPHFAARHDLVAVDDPVLGPLRQQAPYPRLVGESRARARAVPRAWARTTARCGATWSGLTPTELEELQAKGIV